MELSVDRTNDILGLIKRNGTDEELVAAVGLLSMLFIPEEDWKVFMEDENSFQLDPDHTPTLNDEQIDDITEKAYLAALDAGIVEMKDE